MVILYIFPHPDDESFGPSPVIWQQIQAGHEVHILTLTRGGATKQRHKLGLDIESMGEVRLEEMKAVEKILKPAGWAMWDLEDGGLQKIANAAFELLLKEHIRQIQPQLIVTYPEHGVSGHPDHLMIHGLVKTVFEKINSQPGGPKRLAFFTLPYEVNPGNPNLHFSAWEEIDCIVPLSEEARQVLHDTLYCYKSYLEIVESYNVINHIGNKVCFEIYKEQFNPALSDLTSGL